MSNHTIRQALLCLSSCFFLSGSMQAALQSRSAMATQAKTVSSSLSGGRPALQISVANNRKAMSALLSTVQDRKGKDLLATFIFTYCYFESWVRNPSQDRGICAEIKSHLTRDRKWQLLPESPDCTLADLEAALVKKINVNEVSVGNFASNVALYLELAPSHIRKLDSLGTVLDKLPEEYPFDSDEQQKLAYSLVVVHLSHKMVSRWKKMEEAKAARPVPVNTSKKESQKKYKKKKNPFTRPATDNTRPDNTPPPPSQIDINNEGESSELVQWYYQSDDCTSWVRCDRSFSRLLQTYVEKKTTPITLKRSNGQIYDIRLYFPANEPPYAQQFRRSAEGTSRMLTSEQPDHQGWIEGLPVVED